MSQAAKAQEPSMEEILASIRRIIADDDASKAKAAEPAAPPPKPAPPPPPKPAAAAPKPAPPPPKPEPPKPEPEPKGNGAAADILELTEAMEAPAEPEPALQRIDGAADVVYDEAPPEP